MATQAFSQIDSISAKNPLIFDRLTKNLKEYKLDTTAAPNDKITKVIIELRNLRGAFNINEAIEYKLAEDKQKKEMSVPEFEKLSHFFRSGNG